MIRICPNPTLWHKAYQGLVQFSKTHKCIPPLPPGPCILAAFDNYDFVKKAQWEKTVEWATQNGCIELIGDMPDNKFYYTEEEPPIFENTNWSFESAKRPSNEDLEKAMEGLLNQWPEISDKELSETTQPVAFTGKKARRLIVHADATAKPPWGGWTFRTPIKKERYTFTEFRAAVNRAITPHEVDHIDFIVD